MKQIEGKFFDVTLAKGNRLHYILVQADDLGEAVQAVVGMGTIENVKQDFTSMIILKEEMKANG